MNYMANARLMLTKCGNCLGCNRLENENFRGDSKCKNYRSSDSMAWVSWRFERRETDASK